MAIPESIKQKANKIRNEVYGKDVREALASGIEEAGDIADQANTKSNDAVEQVDNIQAQVNQLVIDGDSSVEAAQARVDEKGVSHATLKDRIDDGFIKVTSQLEEIDRRQFNESMINRKEPDGLYLSWVDDDALKNVYDWYKPLLQDYNIPITSAVVTERPNNQNEDHLSWEQMEELSELGMEFISHTHTHRNLLDLSEEEIDWEFRRSQELLKRRGYNYRGLALTSANNSDLIQKVARRYYDYVIGTGVRSQAGYVLYPGEIDNYYITRVTIEHGFDYVKERLDEAHSNGVGWIVFVSHATGSWYSDSYCRQILDYALSLGFKFCNTQEGVERFGNIAQFGNTKIGADGTINSNKLGKVEYRERTEGVTPETPITDFPINTITFTDINTQNADGFPLDSAGILYTHRYSSDAYAYQKYVTSRNHKEFTRNWNINEGVWGDWIERDITQYLGKNALIDTTQPNLLHLQNKISYTQIDSQLSHLFPEESSGLLINYAHEPDNTFPFQEYKLFRKPVTYRRYWVNGSWGEWERVELIRRLNDNSITASTSINRLPNGISYCTITGGGDSTGLPTSYGTIITYKLSENINSMNYQEFKENGGYGKYIRYVDSSGTWKEWRKYVTESV